LNDWLLLVGIVLAFLGACAILDWHHERSWLKVAARWFGLGPRNP
jgi:hypothetical protein